MLFGLPWIMEGDVMSIPQASGGYAMGPREGEALWFNGGLGLLKATAKLTDGRFAALELLAPRGIRITTPHPSGGRRVLRRPFG